ncbi:MAG: hypothetical protein IT535_12380 [Bauldia sp.]|nr:hypothetical protein [Bauldia sp.]
MLELALPGRTTGIRVMAAALSALAALSLLADAALAQSHTRVWDIELGSPVADLPADEFVDPACGTAGGPPSLPLNSFADFARCPVEQATGLREVWFIYDDEWEFIARAQRDEREILQYSANSFFSQPIVTSLLIDDAGLVQGYRIVTDTRAPPEVRIEAYSLAEAFRARFGSPWSCEDLPRGAGENPIGNVFVKQHCERVTEDRFMSLDIRHLYRPGEDLRINPRNLSQTRNDFQSSTRFDVYNLVAVRDAPCCRASSLP